MHFIRCRRVVFFSPGDESNFFRFASEIPAVARVTGEGDAIVLHVRNRISASSRLELRGLLRRYRISERLLASLP
jgi:hypothetical protein